MLREAARRVVALHHGSLPEEPRALLGLEGVGRYTAGAIASIAFKARVAAVDGNVARVLARLFAIEDDVTGAQGGTRVWALAHRLAAVDEGDPGNWTQALMELGAIVCTPREPKCRACPLRGRCEAFARGIASDLPRKKPKREPIDVQSVAIVLMSRSAVLLARRHRNALFGGLWEAPQAIYRGAGHRAAARMLSASLGIDAAALMPAGEVVHVLSHRRMIVHVLRGPLGRKRSFPLPGPDYAAIEAVPLSELRTHTRPHATLTRKVLDMAKLPCKSLP
jgi:A/G-specific adenine glycosylase